MNSKKYVQDVCRDAKNGRFVTAKTAKRRPKTTVTEAIVRKRAKKK